MFKASQYAIESLVEQLDVSDFAIAIAHADDEVTSREVAAVAPRDNVIFELGLVVGRLGLHRSFLIEPRGEQVKLPSDLRGITTLSYRPGPEGDRQTLLGPACNGAHRRALPGVLARRCRAFA